MTPPDDRKSARSGPRWWRLAQRRLVPATASPTFFPGGCAASSRTKKAGFGPSSAVAAAW